jgi:DinB family protein
MTTPETAEATLARFDRAFLELEATVQALGERTLTDARDAAGWSGKDHLMHIAAWEQVLLARLDGRSRHEALGIDAATMREGDDDTINAAVFGRTRHRPLADVLAALRGTHGATRAWLQALAGRGASPAGPHPGAEAVRAFLDDVPSYIEHYEQHGRWIRELAESRPA